MKRLLLLLLFTVLLIPAYSQDTVRVMAYNILDWPLPSAGAKAPYLKTVVNYYHPDILICTEVTSDAVAVDILNNVLNLGGNTYAKAAYTDGPDKDNMIFFNLAKLHLKSQDTIQTALRLINRYRLYHNTVTVDTVYLDCYAAHLKASDGSVNATDRYWECKHWKNYIETKTQGKNIIFGGDFNLYNSTEPAYKLITDSGSYKVYDPINMPGSWNSNAAFSIIHTQSTHLSTGGGFIGGGLDSRFDFLMVSHDIMVNGNHVQYAPGSFLALGNDGLHYNMGLTNTPLSATVPDSVTNALYNMSDHLPVVMKVITTAVVNALPEPTNYPTNYSARNIHLQWTGAAGPVFPDGYLVRMSSVGFAAIQTPVDGTPVANSATDKNIPGSSVETWFGGLNPLTTYYFKIFGYSGTGSVINYKVDGTIPQVSITTTP